MVAVHDRFRAIAGHPDYLMVFIGADNSSQHLCSHDRIIYNADFHYFSLYPKLELVIGW
jgi:hypothetical protein